MSVLSLDLVPPPPDPTASPDLTATVAYFQSLQTRLCEQLEALEPRARFRADNWQRDLPRPSSTPNNSSPSLSGHGRTSTIRHGTVFEKGGVNFSYVSGHSLPPTATTNRPDLADNPFRATGVSLVMHPRNPYIPTAHLNVRFFQTTPSNGTPVWWFGGGFDLTPCYGFDADCVHWHRTARDICAPFSPDYYPRFKAWCDSYFHLPHRLETRGIGGLFFDNLCDGGFPRAFAFARHLGDNFMHAYAPLVERRQSTSFSTRQRHFQAHRRGRYVEFNLLYDRGTLFGLQSGGRVESVLMSMPPLARWQYNWHAKPGSPEQQLATRYLQPRDWLGE